MLIRRSVCIAKLVFRWIDICFHCRRQICFPSKLNSFSLIYYSVTRWKRLVRGSTCSIPSCFLFDALDRPINLFVTILELLDRSSSCTTWRVHHAACRVSSYGTWRHRRNKYLEFPAVIDDTFLNEAFLQSASNKTSSIYLPGFAIYVQSVSALRCFKLA